MHQSKIKIEESKTFLRTLQLVTFQFLLCISKESEKKKSLFNEIWFTSTHSVPIYQAQYDLCNWQLVWDLLYSFGKETRQITTPSLHLELEVCRPQALNLGRMTNSDTAFRLRKLYTERKLGGAAGSFCLLFFFFVMVLFLLLILFKRNSPGKGHTCTAQFPIAHFSFEPRDEWAAAKWIVITTLKIQKNSLS